MMQMYLYPFKFRSRFIEDSSGGHKMETVLGKSLPAGVPVSESWELYDIPPVGGRAGDWSSSPIADGPLSGRTLHWAIGEFGGDLLGDVSLAPDGQFPILIRFLDAAGDLPLQVHPDNQNKTWYTLQADAGAHVINGLRSGTTANEFGNAAERGALKDVLRVIPAKVGECLFLPGGTVHALGAGVLAAEIQTAGADSLRIFDFSQTEASTCDSIAQAVHRIKFPAVSVPAQRRSHVAGFFTTVTRLVASPDFTLEKVRFTEGVEEPVPYDQPVIWIVLEGRAEIRVEGMKDPTMLKRGDTVLLPAAMKKPILKTNADCVWLEVTFPAGSRPGLEPVTMRQ